MCRARHTATRLGDGTVSIAGASQDGWQALANTEVYDPNTGTFSARAALGTPRYSHSATLLDRGKVLVAGGFVAEGSTTPGTELDDGGVMATRGQFPPHDDTLGFRARARGVHRDRLRRPLQRTYVDVNGDVTWIREVRALSADDVSASGSPAPGTSGDCGSWRPLGLRRHCARLLGLPPRSEILAFRLELEQTYRDELRRAPSASAVDAEGVAAWLAEYLRYRLTACSHRDAVSKVMLEIQGLSPPATCQ